MKLTIILFHADNDLSIIGNPNVINTNPVDKTTNESFDQRDDVNNNPNYYPSNNKLGVVYLHLHLRNKIFCIFKPNTFTTRQYIICIIY